MNYTKIKAECPLAWTEFCNKYSFGLDQRGNLIRNGNWNDRDLYDYFDSVGIALSIIATDFGSKINAPFKFGWVIRNHNTPIIQDERYLDSRTEAETEAFTRAFHVREQQLKDKI